MTAGMRAARITVILPCFNGVGTIGEAVRSVWSQERDDIEIVAIDDTSTDDTLSVLRELSQISPVPMRVTVNATNQLTARSINEVYPGAAEFVSILHQDDKYPPGRFDTQFECMVADQRLQIVYANGVNFNDEGTLGPLHDAETRELLGRAPQQIELFLRENQNPIFLQPALIRRDLMDRIGGFDEECMSDDWVTNIRIFSSLADRSEFGYLDENVYLRRKHPDNFHRQQRIMSLLRMEVLQKYARTPRRNDVLARYYEEQAGHLRRYGFMHHAAAMLTLSSLRYTMAGRNAEADRTGDELRHMLRVADSAIATDGNLGTAIEIAIGEAPSVAGYRRLVDLLSRRDLLQDAERLREGVRSAGPLRNVPEDRVDLTAVLDRLGTAVTPFSDPPTAESALWQHYRLLERLRYDLARRGEIA